MTTEMVLEINGLSYRYEKDIVLENVNLSVPKGAFLAIVGPNGSGKSTLLKLILGILRLQKGKITLFGEDLNRFRKWEQIGYVSQKANSFNTGFPATVFEVVESGLTKKLGLFRYFTKEDRKKAIQALVAVGMEKFKHRNIGELSGGQQQRVFIARALVSEPKVLILDEPTVGVDVQNVQSFYQMLADLNKSRNITLLLVTHDIGSITDKVTHVACLNKKLFFHGETKDFEQLKGEGVADFYGYDVHLLSHHHDHEGALR